jgi:hypothetical protein
MDALGLVSWGEPPARWFLGARHVYFIAGSIEASRPQRRAGRRSGWGSVRVPCSGPSPMIGH